MRKIIPLVLAGGASSRFWPLLSKNRFLFMGISVLEHKLNELLKVGFKKVIIVAPKEEREAFERLCKTIPQIEITLLTQAASLGMGDAVLTAKDHFLAHHQNDALYVLNGNDFIDPSWHKQIVTYSQDESMGGVVPGYRVSQYFPGGYLVVDQTGHLQEIVEKPGEGQEPSDLVKMVADLFMVPQDFFEELEKAYSQDRSSDDHYEHALSVYANGHSVLASAYERYWETLKYPWHVLKVVDLLLSQIQTSVIDPSAQIAKTAVLHGPVVVGKGVKIYDHAVINGPCYIGPNTVIGTNALVVKSMIENDCMVGFQSEVTRSYLGSKVWLHQNYVGDSVLDEGVSFGAKAVTANYRFDQGEIKSQVKGEWVNSHLTKLGTIVGKDSRVGVMAQTMPGVKIGVNAMVGPNVTLSKDCADDTATFLKQAHVVKSNQVKLRSIDQ